jgi:hypothetical protein
MRFEVHCVISRHTAHWITRAEKEASPSRMALPPGK